MAGAIVFEQTTLRDIQNGIFQPYVDISHYPVFHLFMDDFSCVLFWELLYQFVVELI